MDGANGRLKTKAFLGLAQLAAVVGLLLFFAAGTWRYVQGWVLLLVFFGSALAITLYLMKSDPELLARRVAAGPSAERRPRQKVMFLVFRENSFAAAVIEVGTDQKVIDTGPYARVRHPMYAGALVLLAGIPLALGSFWGLLTLVPFTAVIVWRLLDEEVVLSKELTGYDAYCRRVRRRLIPGIW